jgi:signal transduction histidine kinase
VALLATITADGPARMSESREHRSSIDRPDREVSFFDWEVSVARARERATALRAVPAAEPAAEGAASEAAYNELALSFEELTVAQEELRALNEEISGASARIEQERLRYHELFFAAPVPYIVTDMHGVIREANNAASLLLRLRADRLRGKPLVVFVRGASRRRLRNTILERQARSGTSSVRFKLSPRDSPPIFAEATLSSAADVDGSVREIRWLVVDRTRAARQARARRNRAAELRQLVAARTAELEEAQRVKDRLVATVSHEFRTGLAAIGGYAELLELGVHGPLTEVQLTDIRRIRSAYEHLGLVVDDLLSYGKIVAGKVSVDAVDIELGDALRAFAELLAPQLRDRNIALSLEAPHGNVLVRADAERLRQILLNVVGNAIKFSPSDSRVIVRWRADAGAAAVEVIDSGPGVPEDQRESVFEPFTRLDNSRSVPGTGLGLAISRELARAMDGELSVEESPHGHGSLFILRLPCSMPLAPEE